MQNVSAIVSELEAACTYGFTHVAGPHVPKLQYGKNCFWNDHFRSVQGNPPHIQNSACDVFLKFQSRTIYTMTAGSKTRENFLVCLV